MKIFTGETLAGFQKNDNTTAVIKAVDLGVKYTLGSTREDLQSISYNFLYRKNNQAKDIWALDGLNLELYQGEIIGIIGSNGAGKTTLCRVISGLLKPDKGFVKVNGVVNALFSLGIGFNAQLTGKENIILNAYMMGLSRKEVLNYLPDIISFSGLGNFINEPIKRYSRGMVSRLGFSVAAMIKPKILVIDEALRAGDLDFNEKAASKIREMVSRAMLVIVVTHDIEFVEEHCTRALWIDRGSIRLVGHPKSVTSAYKDSAPPVKQHKRTYKLDAVKPVEISSNVIIAQKLGVKYKLDSYKTTKSKNNRINQGKGELWALKDLDFKLYKGEILGIIGPNGAGKTTLCRTLCGIYKSDEGYLEVNGTVSAILGFGTGFNIQLSGRDNIYLNGMMLGIPKSELKKTEKDIIEFSELGQFINQPIKYYSDGMKSRLAFSIAAMLRPDILIIDEALSAGDHYFQEKATKRMQSMIEQAKAVIIVTHNLYLVRTFCSRSIWLQDGTVKYDGSPNEAVRLYWESTKENILH